MKLVLFDIDGTLLMSHGAGRRALEQALLEVFGSVGPRDHWFDGKTDPQIVREMMRHDGYGDDDIDARMKTLFDVYVARLRTELGDPAHCPRVLPGVMELLDALGGCADALVGLLTGNLEAGARAKLESVGIDPSRFVIGAYGSDHELRTELPSIAQRRARELLDLDVAGSDVVVIGDTPSDVTCGRTIGARAIGVATGRYSADVLQSYGAHAVFEDLANTRPVLRAIMVP